jgi:uncharacterized protein (TIGR02145 family)
MKILKRLTDTLRKMFETQDRAQGISIGQKTKSDSHAERNPGIPPDPRMPEAEATANAFANILAFEQQGWIRFIREQDDIRGIWLKHFPSNTTKKLFLLLFCARHQENTAYKLVYMRAFKIKEARDKEGFEIIFHSSRSQEESQEHCSTKSAGNNSGDRIDDKDGHAKITNRTAIEGNKDDRFERLVRRLISYQDEATFLDALREATSLAPKGDDFGVRALSEAIRRRCGKREIAFYAAPMGHLTLRSSFEEVMQADERLIELAKARRLLEDPEATQNLMSMALPFHDRREGLSGLLDTIFEVAGSEQGYDFQLLFNQWHSSIKLRHARGERTWTEQYMDSGDPKASSELLAVELFRGFLNQNSRQDQFVSRESGDESSTNSVVDVDGNIYKTVKIGNQLWMAENLRVTLFRNGDSIRNVTNGKGWSNLSNGAYCNYDNDVNKAATYGKLYNWYAVKDKRKIAPAGWHVPTDAEWKQLEMYLGMSQNQADVEDAYRGTTEDRKIKEVGTTHWSSHPLRTRRFTKEGLLIEDRSIPTTNESGFSALPGGSRSGDDSTFGGVGICANFWSSTDKITDVAWFRALHIDYSGVGRMTENLRSGFSVRCVKD